MSVSQLSTGSPNRADTPESLLLGDMVNTGDRLGASDQQNEENSGDDVDDLPVIVAPDGGWGWIVVAASFFLHIICDGIQYSFGLFVSHLADQFGSGRGDSGGIAGALSGVILCSGPISGVLTNLYGCRAVTIAGTLVAFVGLLISVFAPNLAFLYFSVSAVTGFGFGLIYLPAIVSVGFYFDNKRAIATGLAVCGSGVGTFLFAPFCRWLIDGYGWRGSFLFLAGVVLNSVVCGALFRPLDMPSLISESFSSSQEQLHSNDKSDKKAITADEAKTENTEHESSVSVTTGAAVYNSTTTAADSEAEKDSLSKGTGGDSSTHKRLFTKHKHSHSSSSQTSGTTPVTRRNRFHVSSSPQRSANQNARLFLSTEMLGAIEKGRAAVNKMSLSQISLAGSISQRQHLPRVRPMNRKDVLYRGSMRHLPSVSGSIHTHHTGHTDAHISRATLLASAMTLGAISDRSQKQTAWQTLHNMLDISLFRNWFFIVFAISNFFTSLGFNSPFIYIEDMARHDPEILADKESAARLVSIIGIGNTIGRIFFGLIADYPRIDPIYVYCAGLTIAGVSSMLVPFCDSYLLLAVYAGCFGFFIGAYVTLTSVVLVEFLGIEKLTNSFGILLLIQGIPTVLGPYSLGKMYDLTQSYHASFVIVGSVIGLSGLMLLPVPFIYRFLERRKRSQATGHISLSDNHPEVQT